MSGWFPRTKDQKTKQRKNKTSSITKNLIFPLNNFFSPIRRVKKKLIKSETRIAKSIERLKVKIFEIDTINTK
jgi:biotin operon repressor